MEIEIFVGIGEGRVLKGDGILKAIGIGSCIVIILFDEQNKIGGLVHAMLPSPKRPEDNVPTYRYVTRAIPQMLKEMEHMGAKKENIEAYIVGGATIFESPILSSPWSIGSRNVLEARNILTRLMIKIVKEEVGGSEGRSVFFNVKEGKIIVKKREKEIVLR
ncbi:MAG: chemotaxis protein CheD [Candidatus Hydrothermales bacterium]